MLLLIVKVCSLKSQSILLAARAREVLGGDPQNIHESDLAVCTNLCVCVCNRPADIQLKPEPGPERPSNRPSLVLGTSPRSESNATPGSTGGFDPSGIEPKPDLRKESLCPRLKPRTRTLRF